MSKRSRESLTGGTGDVNPQWYKMQLAQAGSGTADLAVSQTFQLPITRIPNAKRITIIEVLKVYYFFSKLNWNAAAGVVQVQQQSIVHTANQGKDSSGNPNIPTITDGSIVDQCSVQGNTVAAGTLPAWIIPPSPYPVVHDLTDGAGHGALIATDQVYLTFSSAGTGSNSNSCSVWMLYRFKNVGIEEYVGIVQSQQNL